MQRLKRTHNAFTLVELLVVIAIISILAGLLLPALEEALAQARIVGCGNNQRQLHLAMSMYTDAWNGAIGKQDFGRAANGSYAGYCHSIIQSNLPVGDGRITINHGAWMAGGLADPELYFCGDPTWDREWSNGSSTIDVHRDAYTGYMRQLLVSGGMEWDAKSTTNGGGTIGVDRVWLINQTSYSINKLLIPGVLWGTGWATNPLVGDPQGTGWRINNTRPEFPLLADSRGYAYTATYHGGRGWNVCSIDGSVAFRTTADVIQSGIDNNVSNNYANYWAGYTTMPDYPLDDPDVAPTGNRPVMQTTPNGNERFARAWVSFYYLRK